MQFLIYIFFYLFIFYLGKDLSSRSETDLNCIFGKRAKSAKDLEQVRDMEHIN